MDQLIYQGYGIHIYKKRKLFFSRSLQPGLIAIAKKVRF
jgi:hypothetical protein